MDPETVQSHQSRQLGQLLEKPLQRPGAEFDTRYPQCRRQEFLGGCAFRGGAKDPDLNSVPAGLAGESAPELPGPETTVLRRVRLDAKHRRHFMGSGRRCLIQHSVDNVWQTPELACHERPHRIDIQHIRRDEYGVIDRGF